MAKLMIGKKLTSHKHTMTQFIYGLITKRCIFMSSLHDANVIGITKAKDECYCMSTCSYTC